MSLDTGHMSEWKETAVSTNYSFNILLLQIPLPSPQCLTVRTYFSPLPRALKGVCTRDIPGDLSFVTSTGSCFHSPPWEKYCINCNFLAHSLHQWKPSMSGVFWVVFFAAWRPANSRWHYLPWLAAGGEEAASHSWTDYWINAQGPF